MIYTVKYGRLSLSWDAPPPPPPHVGWPVTPPRNTSRTKQIMSGRSSNIPVKFECLVDLNPILLHSVVPDLQISGEVFHDHEYHTPSLPYIVATNGAGLGRGCVRGQRSNDFSTGEASKTPVYQFRHVQVGASSAAGATQQHTTGLYYTVFLSFPAATVHIYTFPFLCGAPTLISTCFTTNVQQQCVAPQEEEKASTAPSRSTCR